MCKMMLFAILVISFRDIYTALTGSNDKLDLPSSGLFLDPALRRNFRFLEGKADLGRRAKLLSEDEITIVYQNGFKPGIRSQKQSWCNIKETFIEFLADKKYKGLDLKTKWSKGTDITNEKEQIKSKLDLWCLEEKNRLKPIPTANEIVERLTKHSINSNQISTVVPNQPRERKIYLKPLQGSTNGIKNVISVNVINNRISEKTSNNLQYMKVVNKIPITIMPIINWKNGVELGLEIEMDFFPNVYSYQNTETDRNCRATKEAFGIGTALRNCIENPSLSLGFATNKERMIGFDYTESPQTGNKDYEFRTIGGLSFSKFRNSMWDFIRWLAPIYQQHLKSTNDEKKQPKSIYSFNYEIRKPEKRKFLLTFIYETSEKPKISLFPQITFSCDFDKFEEIITTLMRSNILTTYYYRPQLLIFNDDQWKEQSPYQLKINQVIRYFQSWGSSAWDIFMNYEGSLSQLSTNQKIIIYLITSMFNSGSQEYQKGSIEYDLDVSHNFLKARFRFLPKVPEQFLKLDCKDLDHAVFAFLSEQNLVLPYRIRIPTSTNGKFEFREFLVSDYLNALKEYCNNKFKWKSFPTCGKSFVDCYISDMGFTAVRSDNKEIEKLLPASFFSGNNNKIVFEIRGIDTIELPNELNPKQSAMDIIHNHIYARLGPLIDIFKSSGK